jgi:hypothetical protein
VPEEIRQQLYAEEQQRLERHQRGPNISSSNLPPIHITNMLPTSSSQTSNQLSSVSTPAHTIQPKLAMIIHLDVPGCLDEQVEDYCTWQQSRVKKPALKLEYQKACDLMIDDGMDLGLIRRDPDPKYLIEKKIKRGVAEHIVGDIDEWVKECKRARTE